MEMDAGRYRKLLLGVFVLAVAVRLFGLNFDSGRNYHPDERRIAQAVLDLSFKPLQLNPHFFAYGSFPFYVTKAASTVLGVVWPWIRGYDGVIRLARGLSGLFGALTVVLTALLAARLYGRRVAIWASGLLAIAVLHVQNSHYGVNDVALSFLVLLTLHLLVRWVQDGSLASACLAGVALGLSVATKFSALPLLLPFVVAALARWQKGKDPWKPLASLMLAMLAAAAAFFAGEPYAVLEFPSWFHDVREQSNMVRHAGIVPYTNQYVGARKVLYDLGQLVVWGMGPFLGLAALWGTLRRLVSALSSRARLSWPEWVLLSWAVPYFLVTCWFEVKFPRYLLPLYPLLILWGAKWLVEKAEASSSGLWIRRVVAGGSALYLVAFLSIYTRPFTPLYASEWLYENVPPGSRILSQHWDEGFPFHLPGRAPDLYTVVDFPFYDEDGGAKMRKLAAELASSDWVALQTKRLYGAVTQAHEKFPLTSAAFQKLFAGDLGYTLAVDFTNRPGLFGLTLPDELADESFSVYDHPKVLLFRNDGRLSAAALEEKLLYGAPSRTVSRRRMLLARAAPGAHAERAPRAVVPAKATGTVRSSLPALLLCVLLVELLGLAGWSLLSPHLPPRRGVYALTKVLGVLLFGYAAWLLPSLGLLPFAPWALRLIAAALLLGAFVAARKRGLRLPSRRELVTTEVLVWIPFLVFTLTRALQPEVYWGEKPMDFAFLNALYRGSELPPPEPWLSGTYLSYTYFGHLLMAALGKCAAIHPAVMFNLAIALTASLAAASVFAAGSVLGRSPRVGAVAVAITLFLGNLSGIRETLQRRVIDFNYFWATSRVIKDTINEYPLWSFLFADLHAHVLVFPFTAGFVAVLLLWLSRDEPAGDVSELSPPTATPMLMALLALLLGTVMVTNGWSSPTYVVLSLFLPGMALLARSAGRGLVRFLGGAVVHALLPAAFFVGGGLLLYRPFWRHFTPPERNMGWEREQLAPGGDVLEIFGIFLVLLVPLLFVLWRRALPRDGGALTGRQRGLLWGAAAALLLAFLLPGLLHGTPLRGTIRAFAILLTLFAFGAALHPRTPERYRTTAALATFGFAILTGCEFIWIWDRMNTIFKFYLEAWFLFALAASVVLHDLFFAGSSFTAPHGAEGIASAKSPATSSRWLWVWKGAVALALLAGAYTAFSGAIGVLKMRRVPGPTFTLDGQAYLAEHWPADRAAFQWLAANAPGIPVMCEAYGPSYQDFARVSMNTGLPIVIGWRYHVFQRGHAYAEIDKRIADVETIYTSDKERDVKAALARYHVALVYVGTLERETYRGGNLKKFREWTGLLRPVYENQGVTIFAVKSTFTGSPVTTMEKVVEAREGGAPVQDAPGRLRQPRGIARDAQGNIYVCDFGNNRIQKLDPDLKPLTAWGERGKLPGQFQDPCGVAVGPDGNVYVADTWNGRVQVFDPEGKQLREWGGDFFGPRGIALDKDGNVYLVDTGNSRVIRFTSEGKKELEFGGKGTDPGKLEEPVGIAVDAQGQVYVCDNGNGRVQVFLRDGRRLLDFPVPGWRREVYSEPNAAIAEDGTLWVTVPLEKEVRAYRDGKLVQSVKASALPAGTLGRPLGILTLPGGGVLVSDVENKLVKIK